MQQIIDPNTANNKKPFEEWKSRFIYAMLGIFAGVAGAHNLYAKRYVNAVLQLMISFLWLSMLAENYSGPGGFTFWSNILQIPNDELFVPASILLACEIVWVYLEVFLVRRDADGDFMVDQTPGVRVLMTVLILFLYIILPTMLGIYLHFSERSRRSRDAEADRLRAERHERMRQKAAAENILFEQRSETFDAAGPETP